MKLMLFLYVAFTTIIFVQCRSGKIITKAISPRDTTKMVRINSVSDSVLQLNNTKDILHKSKINFNNFSAKVRLDIETSKGVQPDAVANIKMIKDSLVWISITSTIFNYEVLRVYLFKDSITLIDKIKHEVKYRSYSYLQEITKIPFTLNTIQDLIIGNPIFINENSLAIKKYNNYLLVATLTENFKNLITISTPDNLLEHCKLDDKDINENRTADFTYGSYNNSNGIAFSTYRQIVVTEKNKLDVRMNFKQFEFNKDLSVSLSVPKSYKRN